MIGIIASISTLGFTLLGGYNAGRFAQARIRRVRNDVENARQLARRVDFTLETAEQSYRYAKAAYDELKAKPKNERLSEALGKVQELLDDNNVV